MLGSDNSNKHNTGAVAHDEWLVIEAMRWQWPNNFFKLHQSYCVWSKLKLDFGTILDYSGQKDIHTFFETRIETDFV